MNLYGMTTANINTAQIQPRNSTQQQATKNIINMKSIRSCIIETFQHEFQTKQGN